MWIKPYERAIFNISKLSCHTHFRAYSTRRCNVTARCSLNRINYKTPVNVMISLVIEQLIKIKVSEVKFHWNVCCGASLKSEHLVTVAFRKLSVSIHVARWPRISKWSRNDRNTKQGKHTSIHSIQFLDPFPVIAILILLNNFV